MHFSFPCCNEEWENDEKAIVSIHNKKDCAFSRVKKAKLFNYIDTIFDGFLNVDDLVKKIKQNLSQFIKKNDFNSNEEFFYEAETKKGDEAFYLLFFLCVRLDIKNKDKLYIGYKLLEKDIKYKKERYKGDEVRIVEELKTTTLNSFKKQLPSNLV